VEGPGADIVLAARRDIGSVLAHWARPVCETPLSPRFNNRQGAWRPTAHSPSLASRPRLPHNREGEELTISYGEGKDNHKLMLTYGFADSPPGAPLSLSWTTPLPDLTGPHGQRRLRLLTALTGREVRVVHAVCWPLVCVCVCVLLRLRRLLLGISARNCAGRRRACTRVEPPCAPGAVRLGSRACGMG
jgi:hypothetical protein